MPRTGPMSTLAVFLSMVNVWLTILLLPASCLGLGWIFTTIVLITGPLACLIGVIARQRERDSKSLEATSRAIGASLVTVILHMAKLALVGPVLFGA